jgi:tetratricopeptide (TPR) repeat protein
MNYLFMIAILATVQILTMVMPMGCEASSELLRLRRGVMQSTSGPVTRLVLDLYGEHPTSVDSTSSDKLVIAFQDLRSKLNPEITLSDPASSATSIKILGSGKGSQILVQLRSADNVITHSFGPTEAPKQGLYQMVVEIRPPAKQKVPEGAGKESKTVAKSPEKSAEPGRIDSSTASQKTADGAGKESKTGAKSVEKPTELLEPQPTSAKQEVEEPKYKEVPEADLSEPLKEANRLLAKGEYEQAFNDYSRLLGSHGLEKAELPIALYGMADSHFFMHREELPKVVEEVRTHYSTALKAEPLLRRAAWAYYRMALAYQASDNHQKAIEAFQKAIEDYPKHPALPLCWLGLAVSYQKKASHPQAVSALRSALDLPLDQSQKGLAYWLLGYSYYASGECDRAVSAFEQSLKEAPSWYLEQPMILKYLGECYFNQNRYAKSRDYLLWYLNLQSGSQERDLVLAKIAEIFSVQDEQVHANKLYDHIRSQYPDSEGDIIAQIRNADFLESKGRISKEDDLALFRELAQRPLSPQLAKLVQLKLASREHKYGNFEESLGILNRIQQDKSGKTSIDDGQVLRSRVILDWSKYAFQNHDYGRVIELYERNPNIFAEAKSLELYFMIADSYTRIRQHNKAISLYQQILATKENVSEEDILVRMAECYYLAEDFQSATQSCEKIKGAQFQQRKIHLLAQIYFAQRQYSNVVQCLGGLAENGMGAMSGPGVLSIYGQSLFQLGEYEKAIPWLQKASEQMQKAGDHVDELLPFYTAQATCYGRLKKYDKAIAVLEKAAAVASTEDLKDQLNYDISRYYLEWGQKDKAIQKLTKLRDSPQSFWQTAAKQQLDYIQVQGK